MTQKTVKVEMTSLEVMHRRAVIIMAVMATLVVLKVGAPVLMPFMAAIFLVALALPVKVWLDRWFPESLSSLASILALLSVLGVFVGALVFSAAEMVDTLPKYKDDLLRLWSDTRNELKDNGVDTAENFTLSDLQGVLGIAAWKLQLAFLQLLVIITYVLLAMPEVAHWKGKLRKSLGKERADLIVSAGGELGGSFKSYLIAMTIAGMVSAVGTWIIGFWIELDFTLAWGMLAFFMNFIPVIGAIIMIFPPTIFAFLQYSDPMMPYLVFLCFGALQMFVGNILDPKLQGNMMSISPLVVMFSLALWGYLWGIPGALLSAPLTHSFMIVCNHYDRTRWIACLLANR